MTTLTRRTALGGLATAVAIAPLVAASGARAQQMRIDNAAAMNGVTEVVIGSFIVAFLTDRTDRARAGGGLLAFPNSVVRMSEAEWAYMQAGAAEAGEAALLTAVTPKVEAFAAGAQLTPSIRAVALAGHTPGHSGYEIVSGGDRLLYVGDAIHSSVISVQRPDWVNGWDTDSAAGIATRQGLLDRGASQGGRIYAPHFPFPGLGRFQRRDDGFVWLPAAVAD